MAPFLLQMRPCELTCQHALLKKRRTVGQTERKRIHDRHGRENTPQFILRNSRPTRLLSSKAVDSAPSPPSVKKSTQENRSSHVDPNSFSCCDQETYPKMTWQNVSNHVAETVRVNLPTTGQHHEHNNTTWPPFPFTKLANRSSFLPRLGS